MLPSSYLKRKKGFLGFRSIKKTLSKEKEIGFRIINFILVSELLHVQAKV